MNFNEYYYKKAAEVLDQRRMQNRSLETRRHSEIVNKMPEYAKLEDLIADTSRKLIILMLQNKEDPEEKLSIMEKGNLAIQDEMNRMLVSAGYPVDYLDRIYTCPICKDRGTVNGKWCECFRKIMLSISAEELNSVSPLKLSSFDSFSLEHYSPEVDVKLGTSHRTIMKHNLDYCKKYVQDFSTDSCGILMNGGTGLGKTHLSLAIANGVIEKGYTVIYGSVPELLRSAERENFRKEDDTIMQSLSMCDLLILDDLGAEMDKALYTSLLYEIINGRMSRGLPLIVNSNLSAGELQTRYSDRIWSRLFSLEVLMFVGQDIRMKLKK